MRAPFSFMKSSGGSGFDRFSLTAEGLWLNFGGASPWTPTASAGGSGTGGRNLTTSGALPGSSTLDGSGTADFDGSTHGLISAAVASTHISTGAGTIIVLAKADTSTAAASDFYSDPLLFGDSGGNVGLVFTSSGVRAGVYSASTKQTAHISQSTGSWFMAAMRWDGTDVKCRVNSTDATPVAAVGGAGALGTYCKCGVSYADTARFDGQIAEVWTDTAALSDGDLASFYSALKVAYPSAGLP